MRRIRLFCFFATSSMILVMEFSSATFVVEIEENARQAFLSDTAGADIITSQLVPAPVRAGICYC